MRGLIITHGALGEGLINAAEQILGEQENLIAINNKNMSADSMVVKIKSNLTEDQPTLLMIDFAGSSCHAAALRACRDLSLHAVVGPVTGVNLPLLLTFLTRRNQEKPEDLLGIVIDRAKRGIRG
jgi:mannose PTS system EIIA component